MSVKTANSTKPYSDFDPYSGRPIHHVGDIVKILSKKWYASLDETAVSSSYQSKVDEDGRIVPENVVKNLGRKFRIVQVVPVHVGWYAGQEVFNYFYKLEHLKSGKLLFGAVEDKFLELVEPVELASRKLTPA